MHISTVVLMKARVPITMAHFQSGAYTVTTVLLLRQANKLLINVWQQDGLLPSEGACLRHKPIHICIKLAIKITNHATDTINKSIAETPLMLTKCRKTGITVTQTQKRTWTVTRPLTRGSWSLVVLPTSTGTSSTLQLLNTSTWTLPFSDEPLTLL